MMDIFNDTTRLHSLMSVPEDLLVITSNRVRSAHRLPNLFYYEMRHEDEDWCMPCQLRNHIMVHFFGTIVSKVPIELIECISEDEANYILHVYHNSFAFHYTNEFNA